MKTSIMAKVIIFFASICIVFMYASIVFASGKYGDIDNNGSINAIDALMILKHSSKLTNIEENKLLYADVDGNSRVDAKDALYVLKYSAGIINKFPIDNNGESFEYPSIPYESIDTFINGIVEDFSEEKLLEIETFESKDNKGSFRRFINFIKNNNSIYIPYYEDKVISLGDKEGYNNILLLPDTVYGLPAVMYYTTHNEWTINTYITYMDTLVGEDVINQANDKGTLWLYEQMEDIVSIPGLVADYKEHYEKEIQLSNGTKKAVFIEFNETTTDRVFVTFAYENVIVNAFGNRDALEDWLKGADFKEINLKN